MDAFGFQEADGKKGGSKPKGKKGTAKVPQAKLDAAFMRARAAAPKFAQQGNQSAQGATGKGAEPAGKGDPRKDIMDKMSGLTRSLRSQTVVGQLTSSQTSGGATDALPAWSSLNATQQEAARVLGFSAKTWSRITAAVTKELQGGA